MNHADPNTREGERRGRRSSLDSGSFIRARLLGGDRSPVARYADLALHAFSWPKLIRYELLMLFVGPLPGALGYLFRNRLFPALFRKTGKGVIFGPNLTLRHADRIDLGDRVVLDRDCQLDARGGGEDGVVIGDRVIVSAGAMIQSKVGHIEIGADCNIGARTCIIAQGPIIVEENVSIAGGVMIAGGRHVVELGGENAPRFTDGPIRLGRNAKIGMGAIVQDGVTIGENAIVAPGAVVFESVPPGTVVWGNPARPVRERSGASTEKRGQQAPSPATPGGDGDPLVRQQVREYLRDDLFIEFGPGEFSDSDSLVAAGILDSLALVRLSLWIEQHFGMDVDPASVNAADLESVDRIMAFVGRRSYT